MKGIVARLLITIAFWAVAIVVAVVYCCILHFVIFTIIDDISPGISSFIDKIVN